jgi:hypothetical protein
MKKLFQIIILLGIPHWVVSIIEFVFYQKTSGSLVLATFLLGIGFGGLFIYNQIKGKKTI